MAASTWVTSTDGEKRVNVPVVQGLEVKLIGQPATTTTPDVGTTTWGVFAVYTDGQRVQIGNTSYADKSTAIAAMVTLGSSS